MTDLEIVDPYARMTALEMVAAADQAARAEWLEWRRHGVGASDVAAILGLSRFGSPFSVWANKTGAIHETADNEDLRFGRYAEAMIGPWFTDLTGLEVEAQQEQREHPTDPIARCTLDGLVYIDTTDADFAEPIGALEIKTAQPGKVWAAIPVDYQAQAQWQMHVTGLDRVWFAALLGRRLDVHVLDRDQADIDYMAEKVAAFWADHVVTGHPPEVDGHQATLDALAAVYPESTPDVSVPIDDLAGVLAEWRALGAAETDAKRRRKALAARLQAALGTAEEGTVDGQRAISWRTVERAGYTVEPVTYRALRDIKPKKES